LEYSLTESVCRAPYARTLENNLMPPHALV
jgi:hypothetical protein